MTTFSLIRQMPVTLLGILLATTTVTVMTTVPANAQQSAQVNIPAGSLSVALRDFGRQQGVQVSFRPQDTAGRSVAAISGAMTRETLLTQLLAGTGLSWRMQGANSIVVFVPDATQPDTLSLGTIVVGGAGSGAWNGDADTVYTTPESVAYISAETLRDYRIANPADIFRSTTGVMSGEGRNSGSLNVNIHGMQGQGRVPVRVDGAENASVVYRGYQGNSDRTFVDPDFIGSVGVTKGPGGDRPGIGGSVEIRTVEADDILLPGKTSGFRFRASTSGNTTKPEYGRTSGMTGGYTLGDTEKRPSMLKPTAGSTSLTYAKKTDRFDIVAGLAWRNQGNYHAGTHGPAAHEAVVSCAQGPNPMYCADPNAPISVNGGLTPYFDGEEVMNTSNRVRSGLLKATIRVNEDTEWKLGYSHYDTTFGEVLPARVTNNTTPGRQRVLSKTTLDSLTSRLRYNPADSDLIDVQFNVWGTHLRSSSAPTYDSTNRESARTRNTRWGTEITNTMRPDVAIGDLTVTIGGSYMSERTKPDDRTLITELDFPPRNATRKEEGAFGRANWAINDTVSVHGSLRYTHYSSQDYNDNIYMVQTEPYNGGHAVDPSVGIIVTPVQGVQLYANYREASRLPSIIETSLAYGVSRRSDPEPERAHNIDLGANFDNQDVFSAGDKLGVKFGYFDNRIKNYIARDFIWGKGLTFYNIDQAHFRGIEISGNYERGGFNAGLSATYYIDVEYCRTSNTCSNTSLATDLAANHIPPKFQIAFDASQKFLDDKLTLGGRVSRVGSRAAAFEPTVSGSSVMSQPILWKPYTTVDVFVRYQIREGVEVAFDIENLTDTYYVEPLSLGQIPASGRTARLALDWRF